MRKDEVLRHVIKENEKNIFSLSLNLFDSIATALSPFLASLKKP